MPIANHPVWVDDEHFNIHHPVRHIALPKPGDSRQLKRLAARVMAQHLDRRKPLWEIWIVEGFARRGHFNGFIPLMDSLSLGIVLFSYAGQLCWGFTAEWDLVPDLDDFVADIEASFRELRDVPTHVEVRPMPRRSANAKRRLRPPAAIAGASRRKPVAAQEGSRGAKAQVRRSARAVDSPVSRRGR